MRRRPSALLRDYPKAIVRVRCRSCERSSQHRLIGLLLDHGFDIEVGEMLERLTADCSAREPASPEPCGACLPDLFTVPMPPRPLQRELRVIK